MYTWGGGGSGQRLRRHVSRQKHQRARRELGDAWRAGDRELCHLSRG